MAEAEKESFEESLAELGVIVQSLERGQPTLDESLAQFERGVALLRRCRSLLESAESRILQLVEIDEHGHAKLREFAHEATAAKAPKKSKRAKPTKETPPVEEDDLF